MIIKTISINSSFVFSHSGEGEQETDEQRVGYDVLGPSDASVAFEKVIGFCSEHDDRGRESPKEAKDELFFDIGID